MTVGYKAVGWNRQKKIYDLWLTVGVLLYLVAFIVLGGLLRRRRLPRPDCRQPDQGL